MSPVYACKIIENCRKIAQDKSIPLRSSYTRTVKRLLLALRFANHPKNRKRANKAQRHLQTIAGRLVRELFRKLQEDILGFYKATLERFKAVLSQQKKGKNKSYSLHEPDVYCISKGKEHKKVEFGSKASLVSTKDSGVIVAAMCFKANIYDGHTLDRVLNQVTDLRGERPEVGLCDRGYRGRMRVNGTLIMIPKSPPKRATAYDKLKNRKRFMRRASIETIIGHLKSDHRLARSYLKGFVGDSINLMRAAAAFNFKKLLRLLAYFFVFCFWRAFLPKKSDLQPTQP